VDALRQTLQKESYDPMDALGVDHVVVVEDHGYLPREIGEFVDQGAEHRLHPRPGRAKRGEDAFAEPLPHGPPKRGDEVSEKPDGVVVSLVERHPGD
jgi:hypothetical protein